MKKETIKIGLNERDINFAIKKLNYYKKWMKENTHKLLNALSEEGIQIASVKFNNAIYDGTNDVTCKIEQRGNNKLAILAIGNAVLFIEFGTGIRYQNNHPEAIKNGMVHGKYGYGLGRLGKGWRYKGAQGTNGEIIISGKHAGYVHTYGNPANMSLYLTVRELEEKFKKIAKKVFI